MGRPKKESKELAPKPATFILNGIEFIDISTETYRTYEFENGRVLTIYEPKGINVSASGGHRIVTKDGLSIYVKPAEGWFIHWRTNDPEKAFQF